MSDRWDGLPDDWTTMREMLDDAPPAEEMDDQQVATWARALKRREALCRGDADGPRDDDHPGSLLYGYERHDGELFICRLGVGEEDCWLEYDGPSVSWEAGEAQEALR
jgi:hypothetical protein